jgi:H+/Cl- antiporter ClcA
MPDDVASTTPPPFSVPMRSVGGHRSRLFRAHSLRFWQRINLVFGGCLIGLAGVVMAISAAWAERTFNDVIAHWWYASLLVTPLGFAALAWLTRTYVPNSEGSGIPQAIAARKLWGQRERGKLVSLRIGVGKIVLTLAGLLCGASIGREGPTVQVGASIMFALGRLSPARQPGLILAGAAAGIAAAFNTPLAGVIFAIEEMSRSFDERSSGLVIVAIVAAGIVSLALLGNYTYFGTVTTHLGSAFGWLAVPFCGVVGGLLGGVFSRILVEVARGLPGRIGPAVKRHPILFALACGMVVSLCGLASDNTIFGTGYAHVKALIDHGEPLPVSFGPLKMVATAVSSIAGIPGGLFSPSLAVGAGIGYDISQFLPHVAVGAIILLGMVSYFSGVVQAPITAFVIVAEMTADNTMVVPLMATSLIATGCSRLICPAGVYHLLSRNYIKRYAPERPEPTPGAVAAMPSQESSAGGRTEIDS